MTDLAAAFWEGGHSTIGIWHSQLKSYVELGFSFTKSVGFRFLAGSKLPANASWVNYLKIKHYKITTSKVNHFLRLLQREITTSKVNHFLRLLQREITTSKVNHFLRLLQREINVHFVSRQNVQLIFLPYFCPRRTRCLRFLFCYHLFLRKTQYVTRLGRLSFCLSVIVGKQHSRLAAVEAAPPWHHKLLFARATRMQTFPATGI